MTMFHELLFVLGCAAAATVLYVLALAIGMRAEESNDRTTNDDCGVLPVQPTTESETD